MWEKLKTLSEHPAVKFLKKLCGDPVQMYAVFLITTIMYYYHQNYAWLYTIITIFISYVIMKFYDFVLEKKLLGSLAYVVYFFAGMYLVFMINNLGRSRTRFRSGCGF